MNSMLQNIDTWTMVIAAASVVLSAFLISPVALLRMIALIPYRILSVVDHRAGGSGRGGRNKRSEKRWSVVYDARSGQPIDPAYVKIYDRLGTVIAAVTTDLDGRFNVLLSEGTYRIEVSKTNYSFPSQLLLGKTNDRHHHGLYFGEEFTVSSGEHGLAFSIPMDPIADDWNQLEKKRRKLSHHSDYEAITNALLLYLSVIAFVLFFRLPPRALVTQIFAAIETILLVVWIIRRSQERTLYHSAVIDAKGNAIPHARVSVFTKATHTKIATVTTTLNGHFASLVAPGEYSVEIERYYHAGLNEHGEPNKPFVSKPFVVTTGVIARTFRV